MSAAIARGFVFTHDRFLDPGWTPGPGQRYADTAPKATMIVTRVTATTVWYAYHLGHGAAAGRWAMDRAAFEARFLGPVDGRSAS